MSRRTLHLLAAVTALLALGAGGWAWRTHNADPSDPPPTLGVSSAIKFKKPRSQQRVGGLDVTFIVASDTHLGFDSDEHTLSGALHDPVKHPRGVELVNLQSIRAMNAMPGRTSPFGDTIARPRGVLISGDLTERGIPWQWRHFVLFYGLNGGDGLLDYPVFEGHGNHDKAESWYVLDRIRERHGDHFYSFDWDDLHLVCLGEAPDERAIRFLTQDLAAVGRQRPIVIYFHFPFRGPYSDNWFNRDGHPERLLDAVANYNVIAFFHGHYHASGRYRHLGHDVYNVGAAKHDRHSFAVVRVTDTYLRVASFHHGLERFQWWHEKPINGAPGQPRGDGIHENKGVLLEGDH
ncbi:MAG TPA: hypothetical protein PKD61_08410 [Polyangiaceae bacterium]|nr:hypothetical protein [Polyangiaceae bacterium]